MNGYLEIRVLQIDGSSEIPLSDGQEHRGDCLHLEQSLLNKLVQVREVDHGSPVPSHLFHQEKTTVKAGIRIEDDFQGILGQHLLDLLVQGQRSRRSAWYVGNDIGMREREGGESRKGMRYPFRKTNSTQESAPIVCQCLQCTDRQPTTRNGARSR